MERRFLLQVDPLKPDSLLGLFCVASNVDGVGTVFSREQTWNHIDRDSESLCWLRGHDLQLPMTAFPRTIKRTTVCLYHYSLEDM